MKEFLPPGPADLQPVPADTDLIPVHTAHMLQIDQIAVITALEGQTFQPVLYFFHRTLLPEDAVFCVIRQIMTRHLHIIQIIR